MPLQGRQKQMMLKRILTVVLFLLPLTSFSQNSQSVLTVNSVPAGAEAVLEGAVKVTGITPSTFKQRLVGNYKLKISLSGYETFKTDVAIDPTRHFEINATLNPRSKFKALVKSVVVPGWGQTYLERKKKGRMFTFLTAGSVLAYYLIDKDFDDKYDYYLQKIHEYDSVAVSGDINDLRIVKTKLDDAQNDAYDAENLRRISIGVVAGIYGMNILDVLLFSPIEKQTVAIKGFSLAPSSYKDGVKLTLSKKF